MTGPPLPRGLIASRSSMTAAVLCGGRGRLLRCATLRTVPRLWHASGALVKRTTCGISVGSMAAGKDLLSNAVGLTAAAAASLVTPRWASPTRHHPSLPPVAGLLRLLLSVLATPTSFRRTLQLGRFRACKRFLQRLAGVCIPERSRNLLLRRRQAPGLFRLPLGRPSNRWRLGAGLAGPVRVVLPSLRLWALLSLAVLRRGRVLIRLPQRKPPRVWTPQVPSVSAVWRRVRRTIR